MGLSDRDYMRGPPPREPRSVGRSLRLLAMLAVVGVAFFLLRPGHGIRLDSGRAAESTRWPNGVVRFYNAAADQQWAVDQAVAAWNGSGAAIRFVPVAARDADLVIEDSGAVCHPGAEATVVRPAGAGRRGPGRAALWRHRCELPRRPALTRRA